LHKRSPDLLAGLRGKGGKGNTEEGREGKEGRRKGRGGEGRHGGIVGRVSLPIGREGMGSVVSYLAEFGAEPGRKRMCSTLTSQYGL